MTSKGSVLIAIMNTRPDFDILMEKLWYRIPVTSINKYLRKRWPPQIIAFYQTKHFGEKSYRINYFGKVASIHEKPRTALFPNEPPNSRSHKVYYQICLESVKKLKTPIINKRRRPIIFIPTTMEKFLSAMEINDLFDESPLEDLLWTNLKRIKIPAERQVFVTARGRHYMLDFLAHCAKGMLDIETDGDYWHTGRDKAIVDNRRDNALRSVGYTVLRFNTRQIRDGMNKECLPVIRDTVYNMGGVAKKKIPSNISR